MAIQPNQYTLYADTLLEGPKPPPGASGELVSTESAAELRDELMRLAVIAAHQLKSPLASIQTSLNLLIGGFVGPITPSQRELLENATRSANRGTDLVSDLLRLRSLDVLDPDDLVAVNLRDCLLAATERVREVAHSSKIHLDSSVELRNPDNAWTVADATVVQEVVHVLVDNAVKYTPSGGIISVRLIEPKTPWDLPEPPPGAATPQEGQLAIEVMDSGIGVPAVAWPQLFQEFFRASNARRSSSEGTGLGLAFAARAARLMGGRLRLEPAKSGGVRALLILPTHPAEVLQAAGRQGGARPERRVTQRVVVVGGVSAGSKAAARIARLDPDAQVTVVERGRFLSYAGCGLPYYISGAVAEQRALLSSPAGEMRDASFFHAQKSVRTMDLTEVVSIDRTAQRVRTRRITDGHESELAYDTLVLATGAGASIPDIPGARMAGVYTLHGVEDAEAIRAQLRDPRAKEVVIVGGGVLGCQITESVALRGSRITLLEREKSILGIVDPELATHVERHMQRRGVRVRTGCEVVGIEGSVTARGVRLADGRLLPADFVIMAAGVQPRVQLAMDAGLEIGESGAILVDQQHRTSDPRIFAVGDCCESHHLLTGKPTWLPTGSNATKQGRVAASVICGRDASFPGVVGSMVLKVFDWTVATTGLSAAEAAQAGFDPVTVLIPGPDRAHYLPTSQNILLKLVADRSSRRLLGMQGIGPGEVAKRIDIMATALAAGMDVETVSNLDLAYAPAYSMALDNVITAANVLGNKIDKLFEGIEPAQLHALMNGAEPPVLLDVRQPSEHGRLRLAGSLHIPLGALRGRLDELPRDRLIVTICKIGLRGYEASLVLRHHGFERVRVLDGGLDSWPYDLELL
jgi:NADPH-dependent 2,4-dienoyl-CoA reductase/sulfur reductase-like enzyme/signal transduction histidine kinase/rhodanese-related sulfurtransferase